MAGGSAASAAPPPISALPAMAADNLTMAIRTDIEVALCVTLSRPASAKTAAIAPCAMKNAESYYDDNAVNCVSPALM
jgi:hypothetical protein